MVKLKRKQDIYISIEPGMLDYKSKGLCFTTYQAI
jgi:hypothetical protein